MARLHDNMSSLERHTAQLEAQIKALQEQIKQSLAIHRNWNASGLPILQAAASTRSIGAMLPFRPRNNSGRRLVFP